MRMMTVINKGGHCMGPFHLISTPPQWKRFSEGPLIVISEGVAASAPLIF